MTVYVKRHHSKGEFPDKEGRYLVSNGLGWFEVSYSKLYGFHEEFTDCSGIDTWLEEVVIPSDQDMISIESTYYHDPESFVDGANYILNQLEQKKNGNTIT